MPRNAAARKLIAQAMERIERHGLPMSTQNVKANVCIDDFTLREIRDGMEHNVNALIPVVMKEQGFVITDERTRERKSFWQATADELDEQLRLKTEGSRFDRQRIACDEAVIAFLREKEKDFGYEVYPELFQDDIDRIYAMHGLSSPGGAA